MEASEDFDQFISTISDSIGLRQHCVMWCFSSDNLWWESL